MDCLNCNKAIPDEMRKGTKFCSAICRAKAHRASREFESPASAAVDAQIPNGPSAQTPPGALPYDPQRPVQQAASAAPVDGLPVTLAPSSEPHTPEPSTSIPTSRRRPPNPYRERRLARIPIEVQVLRQAPPEAIGYRLVLPLRPDQESPSLSPRPSVSDPQPFWRLHPFELPDDVRLSDGREYRILWVGAANASLPPAPRHHLPGLRFFLGPPDPSTALEEDEYASILRLIDNPLRRERYEKQIARQRLEALRKRHAEAERARQQADAEAGKQRKQAAHEERNRQRQAERAASLQRATEQQAVQVRREQDTERKKEAARQEWRQVGLAVLVGLSPVMAGGLAILLKKLAGNDSDNLQLMGQAVQELASQLSNQMRSGLPPKEPAAPVATQSAAAEVVSVRMEPVGLPAPTQTRADNAPEPLSEQDLQEVMRLLTDARLLPAVLYEIHLLLSPDQAESFADHPALKQVSEAERCQIRASVHEPSKARFIVELLNKKRLPA